MDVVTSPIRSRAQHAMLKRAITDADYAKSRGISAIHAQSMLDDHEAAGSPDLPERVEASTSASGKSSASKASTSAQSRKFKLLGAH